ncbi:MAG: Gmad2 immunoglobulin-like domain-containing protein [Patescibacteria group bacterium UBA2163]
MKYGIRREFFSIGAASVLLAGFFVWVPVIQESTMVRFFTSVDSFESCVDAGYAVLESHPRQCRDGSGTVFMENTFPNTRSTTYTNTSKNDIMLDHINKKNNNVTSPLIFTGKAHTSWFYEGSFPVTVTNWDGRIIAKGEAQATRDWKTNTLVPFEATLTFTIPAYNLHGTLLLHKANPSGVAESDAVFSMPVVFYK